MRQTNVQLQALAQQIYENYKNLLLNDQLKQILNPNSKKASSLNK